MITFHSSRSRYEAFLRCPRYGYLQYHWGGRGIVRLGKSIFLTTGIWVHKGLELIARWFQKKQDMPEDILDGIIAQIVEGYFNEVFPKDGPKGFNLSEGGMDEHTGERREFTEREQELQQQYTFNEQTALVEALLRIAATRLFPKWIKKYKIVAIEKEMAFPLVKGKDWEVIQSARLDLVLQEIDSKDLYIVSYKSARQHDERANKIASHDTQGLSESWAFEEYLRGRGIDKCIMGIRMLYLIKGARKEIKRGSGVFEQSSGLIRGYRKVGFEGVEYAHSWFFPNPENESGVGALGRKWEKFDVFDEGGLEEVGGIKGWLGMLESGEIQPECSSPLENVIVEPLPFDREQGLERWLRQTKAREQDIAFRLLLADTYKKNLATEESYLDDCFPQNHQACHYYPGEWNDCPYIPLCYGTQEERENPLQNGFSWREPHHEAELVQIKGAGN